MSNKTVFAKLGTMVQEDILSQRQDPYTEDEVMKILGGFGKADKAFASVTEQSHMDTNQCIVYVTNFLNGVTGKDVSVNQAVFFGHEIAKTPIAQGVTMQELIAIVANKQDNLSMNTPMQEVVASIVASMTNLDIESEAA
jgi:hypothetical protein